MTKKQQGRTVSISLTAQVKMALHATKHGFSEVHGIVLGRSVKKMIGTGGNDDDDDEIAVSVTDVVPVCHEAPTKPIVDMALRLVDAHLSSQIRSSSSSSKEEGAIGIMGWYSANADAMVGDDDDIDEMPSPAACRVASSVAECGGGGRKNNDDDDDDDEDGGRGMDDYYVLLLVSTSRLANCVRSLRGAKEEDTNEDRRRRCLPMCAVFERPSSRIIISSSSSPSSSGGAFTQRVDDGRVTTTTTTTTTTTASSDGCGGISEDGCVRVIAEAVERQLKYDGDDGKYVHDFVDHVEDHESGEDWIENGMANAVFVTTLG